MKGIVEILLERYQTGPDRKLFHFVDYSSEEKTVAEVTVGMVFENAKAIAMPKDSGDLKTEIDKIIAEIVESGEYNTYLEEAATYTVVE